MGRPLGDESKDPLLDHLRRLGSQDEIWQARCGQAFGQAPGKFGHYRLGSDGRQAEHSGQRNEILPFQPTVHPCR